ncbi:MAG: hypothetical protein GY928_35475 [Colwellia sp.]|nr:hypothetical protein [Colwellia sp.]
MATSTYGLIMNQHSITIYYESDPVMGVNVTYDIDEKRHYDFFSSLYLFNAWAYSEFYNAELIEITNANYQQLAQRGKI